MFYLIANLRQFELYVLDSGYYYLDNIEIGIMEEENLEATSMDLSENKVEVSNDSANATTTTNRNADLPTDSLRQTTNEELVKSGSSFMAIQAEHKEENEKTTSDQVACEFDAPKKEEIEQSSDDTKKKQTTEADDLDKDESRLFHEACTFDSTHEQTQHTVESAAKSAFQTSQGGPLQADEQKVGISKFQCFHFSKLTDIFCVSISGRYDISR